MKIKVGLLLSVFILLVIGCGKKANSNSGSGTIKDSRDSHQYKWVRIGEQVWMTENMAYLPTVNPTREISYGPKYYVYGYDSTIVSEAKANVNYSTYGVLYSWEAAKTACPSGWHLPSDEEWQILEFLLGMNTSDVDQDSKWRESGSVGKKLKSMSGWEADGNGVDSIGFKALPAGCRYDGGGFDYIGSYAYFWSSTEGGAVGAWDRALQNANEGIFRCGDNKRFGFSVRCVRD